MMRLYQFLALSYAISWITWSPWWGYHVVAAFPFNHAIGALGPMIAGILMTAQSGSILLTCLFNSLRGSTLVSAVFHAAIDTVFVSDYVDMSITNKLGMLVTIWGIVTVFVFRYDDLSKLARY